MLIYNMLTSPYAIAPPKTAAAGLTTSAPLDIPLIPVIVAIDPVIVVVMVIPDIVIVIVIVDSAAILAAIAGAVAITVTPLTRASEAG